jgi:hypothetical protein
MITTGSPRDWTISWCARLFSAGLALETALALIGEHRAAGKIEHAISELDQAITELRGIVFDACRISPPNAGRAG